MLLSCPYCGFSLSEKLKDGIGSCNNCNRVFDSSPFNRILSASWYVRRNHIADIDRLLDSGLKEEDAYIALALAYDADYTHDELLKVLVSLGISKDYIPE